MQDHQVVAETLQCVSFQLPTVSLTFFEECDSLVCYNQSGTCKLYNALQYYVIAYIQVNNYNGFVTI